MGLKEQLQQDIKILNDELKSEEELVQILKKRLTKKEYKLYTMRIDNISDDKIIQDLKLNQERFNTIYQTILKKINYEKLKYELTKG